MIVLAVLVLMTVVRGVTDPTGTLRFAASDGDRVEVLVAQDVPPELLLAAAFVFVVGAALAGTFVWRLSRREG